MYLANAWENHMLLKLKHGRAILPELLWKADLASVMGGQGLCGPVPLADTGAALPRRAGQPWGPTESSDAVCIFFPTYRQVLSFSLWVFYI